MRPVLVFLVGCLLPCVAGAYSGCTADGSQGILMCESAGDGFTRDENKAARCPAAGADSAK